MEEPKQEAAAPAMLKKKKEERELLSFAREMGRRERERNGFLENWGKR